MSKDRLEDLENKYWEGKSSLEDEKFLKATEDDSYFKGLKTIKDEQLMWNFDDFISQTEAEAKKEKEPAHRRVRKPIWKYIGVAAALLTVGFLFLKNPVTESELLEEENSDVLQERTKGPSTSLPTIPNILSDKGKEEKTSPAPLRLVEKKSENREAIAAEQALAEEAYVMINGKPVYDEQKVEEIILASLQLMASNFQEGRQAIEKIKYIRVEL